MAGHSCNPSPGAAEMGEFTVSRQSGYVSLSCKAKINQRNSEAKAAGEVFETFRVWLIKNS